MVLTLVNSMPEFAIPALNEVIGFTLFISFFFQFIYNYLY